MEDANFIATISGREGYKKLENSHANSSSHDIRPALHLQRVKQLCCKGSHSGRVTLERSGEGSYDDLLLLLHSLSGRELY